MSGSILRTGFQLNFQVSPILLQNGIANAVSGGILPIVALTEAVNIIGDVFSGSLPDSLDDFFAQFLPLPGGNLLSYQYGTYPFANQVTAANAGIKQPLNISLVMISPVREAGGYLAKLPIFTALQAAIDQHIQLGGSIIIATPAFIYTNALLLQLTDITGGETKQKQAEWQWDFFLPLISQAQATSAYNGLLNRINSGQQINGLPSASGLGASAGQPLAGASALTQIGGSIAGQTGAGYVSAVPAPVSSAPLQ